MKHTLGCTCVLALFGGCYNSSFVRNDSPVRAGGVAVSVVGQLCDYSPDFDAPDENGRPPNRLDLGLRVAIENAGSEPVLVTPQNLRLMVGDHAEAPMFPPKMMEVAPGKTAKVNVRFQHHGDEGCDANVSLNFDQAVLVGVRPIPLRALSFVAAPANM